jgi:hypothetical protein
LRGIEAALSRFDNAKQHQMSRFAVTIATVQRATREPQSSIPYAVISNQCPRDQQY